LDDSVSASSSPRIDAHDLHERKLRTRPDESFGSVAERSAWSAPPPRVTRSHPVLGSEFTRVFISRRIRARPISSRGIQSTGRAALVDVRAEIAARLRRSAGFAVETQSGRFGTVEAFRDGGGVATTDVLVVRAGRFGRRRILISVDDVAAVRPRDEVVQLRSKWMTIQT
jgi:hypothetical protein